MFILRTCTPSRQHWSPANRGILAAQRLLPRSVHPGRGMSSTTPPPHYYFFWPSRRCLCFHFDYTMYMYMYNIHYKYNGRSKFCCYNKQWRDFVVELLNKNKLFWIYGMFIQLLWCLCYQEIAIQLPTVYYLNLHNLPCLFFEIFGEVIKLRQVTRIMSFKLLCDYVILYGNWCHMLPSCHYIRKRTKGSNNYHGMNYKNNGYFCSIEDE